MMRVRCNAWRVVALVLAGCPAKPAANGEPATNEDPRAEAVEAELDAAEVPAPAERDVSALLPGALPRLVPEGAPSPATLYSRTEGLLAVTPEGRVECVARTGRELPAHVDPHTCRDERLSLRMPEGAARFFQDGTHSVHGALWPMEIALEVDGRAALKWDLQPDRVPIGCGQEGHGLMPRQLKLDIACRGDIAAVRWVVWRGFLSRPCEPAKPYQEPILDCGVEGGGEPSAKIVGTGIGRIDLRSGEYEAL